MKKWLVAIFLCLIVVVAAVIFVISRPSGSKPPLKIGIFYYVWYNPAWEFSWNTLKIVDQPVLGFYNSSDPEIIRHHLLSMTGLCIDFAVISWLGNYDDYGRFTDNAAKQVFKIEDEMTFENGEESMSKLKFIIMVEPFNKSGSSYNYEEIYEHIYSEFVEPYPSIYYNDSKPLICFFNNENLTDNGNIPLDARFSKPVLVGSSDSVQWIYTDLNSSIDFSRVPYANETSVTPRFDTSHIQGRPVSIIDPDLTQGIYDREWENATHLLENGKINTILITSWNEFPERTAIEPHYDATATNKDPGYLYNKTKDHINQIRQARACAHFTVSVDPMRVVTVPNTVNGKTGLICRFIGTPKDLELLGIAELLDMSKVFPCNSHLETQSESVKSCAKNLGGAAVQR